MGLGVPTEKKREFVEFLERVGEFDVLELSRPGDEEVGVDREDRVLELLQRGPRDHRLVFDDEYLIVRLCRDVDLLDRHRLAVEHLL